MFYLLQSNMRYFLDHLERFRVTMHIHVHIYIYMYVCPKMTQLSNKEETTIID